MKRSTHANENIAIWVLIAQTREVTNAVRENELRKYGISPRQVAVLLSINIIGDGATPAKISRWIGRKAHTISGILTRMEKQGLISRSKDLDKKNLVRITMTEKGKLAFQQSLKREAISLTLSCLSDEEKRQLLSSLRKVRDNAMSKLGTEYKPFLPHFK